MPTTLGQYSWDVFIGTGVFLSLGIGLIMIVIYSQRRFLAAQEEKFSILQESEQRFRRLVEDSPTPTAVTIHGVVTYLNAAVQEVMKAPLANDVLGKPFAEFLHEPPSSQTHTQITEALEHHQPIRKTELALIRCDEQLIETEFAAIPIMYDGKEAELIVLRDITESKRAEEALREIPRKIIAAQEAERRRFARELHDGVNQILFNVKGKIETLEKKIEPFVQNDLKDLSPILDPLKTAMKEIQWISRNLRPSALDDLGLAAAINSMSDEFTFRTHIRVTAQGFPRQRLSAEVELALFRIVQEALNNVEKHSMATQVLVECTECDSSLRVIIADNGKGIQNERLTSQIFSSGIGLTTMRERAELVGGTMSVSSNPGKGTQIIVTVPVVISVQGD